MIGKMHKKFLKKHYLLKNLQTTLNNLSVLNFYKGNFEKACEMYSEALKFNNNDYQVWGHLAESYANLNGQKNKSLQLYQKAIEFSETKFKG